MAAISDSGGVGGTTRSLTLPGELNLISFTWQNYTIPDEFQIQYKGQRVAGDVGLQSGGQTGTTVVAASSSPDQITVKVTAPTQGTAWDFTVEANPLELHVDLKLGDVTKVSIGQLFKAATGRTLASVGLDPTTFQFASMTNPKGKVAEVDNWQDEFKKGVFYFAPTVAGTPLNYGDTHTTDDGLGDSQLLVRGTLTDAAGSRQIEFPVRFTVTDGFSTIFTDPEVFGPFLGVNGSGTTKLDIYRQEQRLAYLGFPGSGGDPLKVDGVSDTNTEWAKKLFSIALDPAKPPNGRGSVQTPTQGTKFFKEQINSATPISWNYLATIPNVTLTAGRPYGMDASGRLIAAALQALGRGPLEATTGVVAKNGTGAPSVSHEGGRAVDFDDIPGQYFFRETVVPGPGGGTFVSASAAEGGGFIVENPNGTYRGGGDPASPTDRLRGLRTAELIADTTTATVTAVRDLMDYKRTEPEVQAVFDAFQAAGATQFLHNDPRFFSDGNLAQQNWTGIKFFNQSNHFNHIHVYIPSPIPTASPLAPQAFPGGSAGASFALTSFGIQANGRLSAATDLGRLGGTRTISGALTSSSAEQIYRFEIGDVSADEVAFDTPRDLSVFLNGLSDDVDIELIIDPNGDGEGQVLFNSATGGTAAESIDALQQATGVYYVRVFKRAGDTNFDLSLSLTPLSVPADGAGSTVATAADLGALGGAVTRSDFVGEVDPEDLYAFQLSAVSDVTLTVGGLGLGDASLAIGRDANGDSILDPGEIIAYSDVVGNDLESLNLTRLAAGSYLVQVFRVSGNSSYQLQASAAASTIPVDGAGATIATAFDAGPLSGPVSFNDFVGGVDPVDMYRFSVATLTGLSINLSGLSADADLGLFRDANGNGLLDPDEVLASSAQAGTSSEGMILTGLLPGNYIVRVSQYEGETAYSLSLTPQAATGANLAVTRANTSPSAGLGSQYTYTVTVTNNGPDMATDVVLTETLPVGLTLIRADKSDPTSSVQTGGNRVVGRVPTLAPGASASFTITVSSFIAGELLSVTDVSSGTADFDESSNRLESGNVINAITSPPADLELNQSVSELNPNVGGQITLTLSVVNKGPGTATDVKVGDVLPTGLTYVSSSADLGSYDPATGVWTVGNMLPNATLRLRIIATVDAARTLTNTAQVVAAAESDPDSTANNNQPNEDDQASVTIIPAGSTADLALSQTVSDPNPIAGRQVTFTVTLTNGGPGAATGIRVRDALPAGLTYVSSSADLGGYDAVTGLWIINDMPSGASAVLRITASAATSVPLPNTAEVVASDQFDPDSTPGNNQPAEDDQASATVLVRSGNQAPALAAIGVKSVRQGARLSFKATATDQDPGQTVRYGLAPGAPSGATIDPTSGQFTWSAATPGLYRVTIVAIDNGTPVLSDSKEVTITVTNASPTVTLGAGLTTRPYIVTARIGRFTDAEVGRFSAVVDYGDGSGPRPLALNADRTFRLAHSYVKSGRYVVNVTVRDDHGGVGSGRMIVTVGAPAPSGFGAWRDAFVRALYIQSLNRDPEPAGLRFWSGALAAGARPRAVAFKIWSSPEHRSLVNRQVIPPIDFRNTYANALIVGQFAVPSFSRRSLGLLNLA